MYHKLNRTFFVNIEQKGIRQRMGSCMSRPITALHFFLIQGIDIVIVQSMMGQVRRNENNI